MKIDRAVILLSIALAACGGGGGGGYYCPTGSCGSLDSSAGPSDAAVDLAQGSDLATNAPLDLATPPDLATDNYPAGPFGTNTGDRIANLALSGQRDDNGNGVIDAGDQVISIHLADYYANKKIEALVLVENAAWCSPCKAQQPALLALYQMYKAGGHVAFLQSLVAKKDQSPADIPTIDDWAATYKIPYDMAIDPMASLLPFAPQAAFPAMVVIRTKDMTIDWADNGSPTDGLKQEIDSVLANP